MRAPARSVVNPGGRDKSSERECSDSESSENTMRIGNVHDETDFFSWASLLAVWDWHCQREDHKEKGEEIEMISYFQPLFVLVGLQS